MQKSDKTQEAPCILCHKRGGVYRTDGVSITITTACEGTVSFKLSDLPMKMVLCHDCETAIDNHRGRDRIAMRKGIDVTI